jgi:glycosyltransferase involved in cell wall biosynthesis
MPADLPARRLWIGLPAYNEEATIPALFPRFKNALADTGADYRIVLYNDGCTDRTVERALEWKTQLNVEVIGKPVNQGLGEGLRCLVAHATEHGAADDVLFIMDCDDTHHPRQFAGMLAALDRGFDVVIASRYRRGARIAGVAPHRQVLSLGAATLFKLLHWRSLSGAPRRGARVRLHGGTPAEAQPSRRENVRSAARPALRFEAKREQNGCRRQHDAFAQEAGGLARARIRMKTTCRPRGRHPGS